MIKTDKAKAITATKLSPMTTKDISIPGVCSTSVSTRIDSWELLENGDIENGFLDGILVWSNTGFDVGSDIGAVKWVYYYFIKQFEMKLRQCPKMNSILSQEKEDIIFCEKLRE